MYMYAYTCLSNLDRAYIVDYPPLTVIFFISSIQTIHWIAIIIQTGDPVF